MTGTQARWVHYDRMASHVLPATSHLLDLMSSRAVEPGRLLDIGSGTGTGLQLSDELGWCSVGVDLSADQLAIGRRAGRPQACADAHHLPFRADTFRAALSNFALIFASSPPVVAREIRRVLMPHGTFAFSAWRPGGWADRWRGIIAATLDQQVPPFPTDLGREADALDLLTGAGFDTVEVVERALTWHFESPEQFVEVITQEVGGLRPWRHLAERSARWDELRAGLQADITSRARRSTAGIVVEDHYLAVAGRAR